MKRKDRALLWERLPEADDVESVLSHLPDKDPARGAIEALLAKVQRRDELVYEESERLLLEVFPKEQDWRPGAAKGQDRLGFESDPPSVKEMFDMLHTMSRPFDGPPKE